MEEEIAGDIMQTKLAEDDVAEQEQQQEQEERQEQQQEPEQQHEPACDAEPTQEAAQHTHDAPAPPAPQQQQQPAHCQQLHTTSHVRRAHAAGQHTSSGPGSKGGLTFSGPPYVPKAKPYARTDFSHSTNRLMKITHDNLLLVDRLMTISHKEPDWVKQQQNAAHCTTASSAVNRRKQATTVAQENHALYQRLVAIQPSKDISRETLEAEHRRNELYRANCAAFKPAHESA